jgi:hypothetical protein
LENIILTCTVPEGFLLFSIYSTSKNACRWRMDDEDVPMLHQYVEFKKGLPIQLEPL